MPFSKRKNYVLIGCPGAGKSTIAKKLSKKGFQTIQTGDLIRYETKANGSFAKLIDQNEKTGILISDSIVFELIKQHMQNIPQTSFVLDSFPINKTQYILLKGLLERLNVCTNSTFAYIKINTKHALKRILNRRTCAICAQVYNLITRPPKIRDTCDKCAGFLFERPHDQEPVAKKLIQYFQAETFPLLEQAAKDGFDTITWEMF